MIFVKQAFTSILSLKSFSKFIVRNVCNIHKLNFLNSVCGLATMQG